MLRSSKYRRGNVKFHRRTSLGFHEGIEDTIGLRLLDDGETFEYEPGRLKYPQPDSHYTPDFILPNGIVVESKGYFTPEDRTRHLVIQKAYPDLDLRFVFTSGGGRHALRKGSKTTWGDWCYKHGFKWHEQYIPTEWLREPPNEASLKVLKENLIRKGTRKSSKKGESADCPLCGDSA